MIDWTRVRELQGEVGADDFDEVVALFLHEVEEVIDRLSRAPSLPDLEQNLHFLKGGAMNLGFVGFSRLCHDGESKSAAGLPDRVDVAAVIAEYEASKREFLENMKTRLD